MSLIVLYFLHSTSVLSFYIDVVLILSISGAYQGYPQKHQKLSTNDIGNKCIFGKKEQ